MVCDQSVFTAFATSNILESISFQRTSIVACANERHVSQDLVFCPSQTLTSSSLLASISADFSDNVCVVFPSPGVTLCVGRNFADRFLYALHLFRE